MNLSFLVHRSARFHKQTYWKVKSMNRKKLMQLLDSHYGSFIMKNCFSLPKLIYFLRTCTCFNHPALLERYDKTIHEGLSIVCNVNFDNFSSTQLALPAEMVGLGVSSASLLALPAFLASTFGASDYLTTIFSETIEDVLLQKRLRNG